MFLTGYAVAVVTFSCTKMAITCPAMAGHLFNIITQTTEKSVSTDSSKNKFWKHAGDVQDVHHKILL